MEMVGCIVIRQVLAWSNRLSPLRLGNKTGLHVTTDKVA